MNANYVNEIDELLEMAIKENASDIHLAVNSPPIFRINGFLIPLDLKPLLPEETLRFVKSITSDDNLQKFNSNGGVDFGFAFKEQTRFRASIFKERGNATIALRLIPNKLLTLDEIGLPHLVKELLFKPRGLVLVTGPTGSGKTTTLASMINTINQERDCHILTIEDPIEYYHTNKKSLIAQREVNVDVPSFEEAIKRGLRQDPDVILVGEMRDLETMKAAITAAETGHLVFATLHTTGAAKTVDRIVDAFPTDQQPQIRTQLASSIVAIISQLLLTKASGQGRVAAFEFMVNTNAIQNHIREKKSHQIQSEIQTGGKLGMITLDAHLIALFNNKLISYEDLITKAQDQDYVLNEIQLNTLKTKKK